MAYIQVYIYEQCFIAIVKNYNKMYGGKGVSVILDLKTFRIFSCNVDVYY